MKQAEIKRTLPSRSENNPEDEEEKKVVENARKKEKGIGYGFSLFAQLKFPFLSSVVGFVFFLSIRDRGIKGTLCRGNNNSPFKKAFSP